MDTRVSPLRALRRRHRPHSRPSASSGRPLGRVLALAMQKQMRGWGESRCAGGESLTTPNALFTWLAWMPPTEPRWLPAAHQKWRAHG